eukprot:1656790-Amphidinium_carterae.1
MEAFNKQQAVALTTSGFLCHDGYKAKEDSRQACKKLCKQLRTQYRYYVSADIALLSNETPQIDRSHHFL